MPHPPRREGDKCPKGCACVLQEKRSAPEILFCAMCGARYEAALVEVATIDNLNVRPVGARNKSEHFV